jgi:hypothetical protein
MHQELERLRHSLKAKFGMAATILWASIRYGGKILDAIGRGQTAHDIWDAAAKAKPWLRVSLSWVDPTLLTVGLALIVWAIRDLRKAPATVRGPAQGPILAAHFLRLHLMPRSPLQSMVDQVFKAAGRADYETSCDFLFKIFLVNTTDNPATVKNVTAEAQIGGEWKALTPIEDLTDYQLELGEGPQAPRKDLTNLAKIIDGVPLTRGVGYRGWLRFELVADRKVLFEKVSSRVQIVDALGGSHDVSLSEPLETGGGTLVHNPDKLFAP